MCVSSSHKYDLALILQNSSQRCLFRSDSTVVPWYSCPRADSAAAHEDLKKTHETIETTTQVFPRSSQTPRISEQIASRNLNPLKPASFQISPRIRGSRPRCTQNPAIHHGLCLCTAQNLCLSAHHPTSHIARAAPCKRLHGDSGRSNR
jgi:hypothetical protein